MGMDDASDAWMNDDVGTIDSESEADVEKFEETTVQIKEEVKQTSEDTNPAIAGLPMDDASEAWMNDDVGTIDSDSEDDVEKDEESTVKIEEKVQQLAKETKPAIAGLPMD